MLYRLKCKVVLFLVNKVYVGTYSRFFEKKRRLLNSLNNFRIGEGSKVVGPIVCIGTFECGKNCWVGKNLFVNGNGTVTVGDNCDIAPEVTFQTGGHEIGGAERRAGKGKVFSQSVGDGTWIGGRVTVLNDSRIGKSCVVAGCACVVGDVPDHTLAGGVPAKVIRELEHD